MFALKNNEGKFVAVKAQKTEEATHSGGGYVLVENHFDGGLKFNTEKLANRVKTILPKSFNDVNVVPL